MRPSFFCVLFLRRSWQNSLLNWEGVLCWERGPGEDLLFEGGGDPIWDLRWIYRVFVGRVLPFESIGKNFQ